MSSSEVSVVCDHFTAAVGASTSCAEMRRRPPDTRMVPLTMAFTSCSDAMRAMSSGAVAYCEAAIDERTISELMPASEPTMASGSE